MATFVSVLSSKAPPRPTLGTLLVAVATASIALCVLVLLGMLSGHILLIPPMAASMALVAGAPGLPLSQPRNVIGGQVISASVGVLVGSVDHSLWAGAVAGGVALGAMLATRTSHSPAAATAVIGALTVDGHTSFVVCAALAAVVLVAAGWTRAKVTRSAYPAYWW
ncbi:MAG: HPP family protein [Rhodococcus sp. (in: high G+C Gram-positive bacteria)]|uniref:HPP family protein n=1 Tax=Rhodococcus sp. TaxID=1831 RepID=UPI003BB54E9D